MQMYSSARKFGNFVIVLSCLILVVAACGQRSTPTAEAPSQPTIYTPEIIMDFIMPADVIGVIVDENIKVLEVESRSAAELAGVQVGDVLDSLEGISFKDREKVKAKIHEPMDGKRFKLKLRRNDENIEVDISPAPPAFVPAGNNTPTPVLPPQDYF